MRSRRSDFLRRSISIPRAAGNGEQPVHTFSAMYICQRYFARSASCACRSERIVDDARDRPRRPRIARHRTARARSCECSVASPSRRAPVNTYSCRRPREPHVLASSPLYRYVAIRRIVPARSDCRTPHDRPEERGCRSCLRRASSPRSVGSRGSTLPRTLHVLRGRARRRGVAPVGSACRVDQPRPRAEHHHSLVARFPGCGRRSAPCFGPAVLQMDQPMPGSDVSGPCDRQVARWSRRPRYGTPCRSVGSQHSRQITSCRPAFAAPAAPPSIEMNSVLAIHRQPRPHALLHA